MIEVNAPGARAKFDAWLKRGDAIGVFSNHDLGSRDVGRRVFLPLATNEVKQVKVGVTRAPDTGSYGLGWRYLLDGVHWKIDDFKFTSPEEGT